MFIRTILVVFLLFVLVDPIMVSTPLSSLKTMEDYVVEYLKIFENLEYAEVMSVIMKESNGKDNCKTWEPSVNEYSYGPLQVLGSTAQSKGYKGDLDQLLSWEYGLYFGMAFLSDCKERATYLIKNDVLPSLSDKQKIRSHMYAMYNAGKVKWKEGQYGEEYINHSYVVQCEYLYWRYKKYNNSYKSLVQRR